MLRSPTSFAVFFVFVAVFACTFGPAEAQQTGGCTQDGAWNDTAFQQLLQSLIKESNEILRYDLLKASLQGNSQGFTSNQTLLVLQTFKNELYIKQVLVDLSQWILGMKCDDVLKLLLTMSNSLLRLDVLPYLVNLTIDLQENNATILKAWTNTFDRDDAKKIIDAATPYSCIWGDVNVERLIFVVDTSGSMDTKFK